MLLLYLNPSGYKHFYRIPILFKREPRTQLRCACAA
ncbi:hypothetical protein CLOBOL_05963 [Enterocloster bolteae ATCC BAA-613]|uniref:Uncharacterized protein n=1 Tax=Enterocloster bolteae (strain ATCC BAA-613 / DSM 15670 / CCUG 46953 / JCM 12243 / WAL 16351) TaxID=411902 RepID=A8S1G5_ENTBW|nr:hypothetical protein CLOBOL_05963 [Enterocloster bolteae ATCC BAA-613]